MIASNYCNKCHPHRAKPFKKAQAKQKDMNSPTFSGLWPQKKMTRSNRMNSMLIRASKPSRTSLDNERLENQVTHARRTFCRKIVNSMAFPDYLLAYALPLIVARL